MAVIEGETVFEDTYVKSVETEITMERKFTTPGYVYNLSLIRYYLLNRAALQLINFPIILSFNMHDVTAPNIIMKWRILCANPVKPEDWELVYNKSIHYGELSTK